jgi:hypothetical protein
MDTVDTVDTEALVITGAMAATAIQFTEATTVLITERDMVAMDIKVCKEF